MKIKHKITYNLTLFLRNYQRLFLFTLQKGMSVKYSVLSDIEHIIKRPDSYMGENVLKSKKMFIYNPSSNTVTLSKTELTYSTGLLKIFDEILMNAIDNLSRKPILTYIYVTITDEYISIKNDGQSIPLHEFSDTIKEPTPQVLFTKPRSGSNFDDSEERVVGGRNGIGCKITSIFSKKFIIDIINSKQHYYQEIENHTLTIHEPVITKTKDKDYVCIIFYPDLKLFKLKSITDDIKSILYKRCHDLSYLPVNITINNVSIPQLSWEQFVQSYLNEPYPEINTFISKGKFRWCVSWFISNDKPIEISFVNNIRTYNGGTHVKYIREQIVNSILKLCPKKLNITAQIIKSKLSLFISATVINPAFNGQAKEKLSTNESSFGTNDSPIECKLPAKLIKTYFESNNLIDIFTNKLTSQLNNKLKKNKVKNIEKLVEANYAGTSKSQNCTLFICEGLSAKTMCDAGICILGHDLYGVYPLQGKVLNSRNASIKQYTENKELTNLKTILGLIDSKTYDSTESLRYGHVVCVKDADSDGADIMGLVINFFDSKFPSLLKIDGFFSEFISPMIQVMISQNSLPKLIKTPNMRVQTSKAKNALVKIPFYNEVEYKNFISRNQEHVKNVKFIKGLATNEDDDITYYFQNYSDNCIPIEFPDNSAEFIDKAFNETRADDRKQWMTEITLDTHLPRIPNTPISVIDFTNNDLVLYFMDSCVRCIPNIVDGLKPSQRKILYTLFGLGSNATKFMKVFQLGGLVAKTSNYHHGDMSMNTTIVKMAQDFAGSNNIPLLARSGQFGSRLENGDDHGQVRYISCALAEISRYIFPKIDDVLLEYIEEDNQTVEPKYYVPIIPMVLVNGSLGIGTGWSTDIPLFNPFEIITYIKDLLSNNEEENNFEIHSFYKGFTGRIQEIETHWIYYGSFVRDTKHKRKITVTEIPFDMSISNFQKLLNNLSDNEQKIKISVKNKFVVNDGIVVKYLNKNTKDPNTVNYQIEFAEELTDNDIMYNLKLISKKSKNNMVLFNAKSQITKYNTIYEIIDGWWTVRYELYEKRIKYQIDELEKECKMISNKARFIKENIEETINIRNVPIQEIYKLLEKRKFDRSIDTNSYDYLVDMKIRMFSKEKYEELLNKLENIKQELTVLRETTVEKEWLKDLASLEKALGI